MHPKQRALVSHRQCIILHHIVSNVNCTYNIHCLECCVTASAFVAFVTSPSAGNRRFLPFR